MNPIEIRTVVDAGLLTAIALLSPSKTWLVGSSARGDADIWSDVDLIVEIPCEKLGALDVFSEKLEQCLAPIYLKFDPRGTYSIITQAWRRFDITLVGEGCSYSYDERVRIDLDASNTEATRPTTYVADSSAELDVMERIIADAAKIIGLFDLVIGRHDRLVGVYGCCALFGLRAQYALAAKNSQGGLLRMRKTLGTDEYHSLVGLPPIVATFNDLLIYYLRVAESFEEATDFRQRLADKPRLEALWRSARGRLEGCRVDAV